MYSVWTRVAHSYQAHNHKSWTIHPSAITIRSNNNISSSHSSLLPISSRMGDNVNVPRPNTCPAVVCVCVCVCGVGQCHCHFSRLLSLILHCIGELVRHFSLSLAISRYDCVTSLHKLPKRNDGRPWSHGHKYRY